MKDKIITMASTHSIDEIYGDVIAFIRVMVPEEDEDWYESLFISDESTIFDFITFSGQETDDGEPILVTTSEIQTLFNNHFPGTHITVSQSLVDVVNQLNNVMPGWNRKDN